MEEEPGEPVEAEPEEEAVSEAPPRKGRRTLIVIVAVVLVVALVGGIVFITFFSNAPPVPSFKTSSVDLRLSVNAEATSDPNGDAIADYAWNFGDGATVHGASLYLTTHTYTSVGTYTVTLAATDSRGAAASTSQSIKIIVLPTPYFIARQAGLVTTFDASGSYASPGKTITTYQWNFGDGTTDTSPVTTHPYATPNRYEVTLNVTDSSGMTNEVHRFVSANTSTVDILADQFFVAGCPYKPYWNLRFHTYGDVILRNQDPCTDYYPWVLYSSAQPDVNPSWVYTLYHEDMRATHNLGYNVANPVVLPVLNPSADPAPDSYLYYNFTFNYLDSTAIAYYQNSTAWPVNSKYSDGFGYVVQGNITMDLQESKRIFGVGEPVTLAPTTNAASGWTNPSNGYTSDGRYATTNVNGAYAAYGGYGVPQATVPIQKVEVGVKGWTRGDDQVRLNFSTDGGATWTNAGTVNLGTSNVTQFFDITGLRTWTAGLLSNANFRTNLTYVQVGGVNDPINVDWVPIHVQSSDASWWWAASTKPGGAPPLVGVENQMGIWLDDQGNTKYDIYNAFQWFYESDIVDLNATVNPTTGQTTIKTFYDGWGFDVLMARWFYWGNASYKDATNAPYGQIKPKGWMPFETCWCENATVSLVVRDAMDAHVSATSEYWFGAVGEPGPDGTYGTADDLSGWTFAPTLMDYMPPLGSNLPGASQYPNSELKWYIGSNQVVTTPGSYAYGSYFEYMTVPNRWNTSLGNTLTLVMPRTEIPWYDAAKSTWDNVNHIGKYSVFLSTLTLRSVTPTQGDYYRWDDRGKVLSVAWPAGFTWQGSSSLPLSSSPTIEFSPETLG